MVNLTEEFDHFLKGPYKIAMRVALQEIEEGSRGMEPVREERGWKLFLLLPRMIARRGCPVGRSPRRSEPMGVCAGLLQGTSSDVLWPVRSRNRWRRQCRPQQLLSMRVVNEERL